MSGVSDDRDLARVAQALASRYRVEREIGRGGMATVYLASDLKHHRRVAIKVLRADLTGSIGPRFLREIDVVARLVHPHIIPLFDSGQAEGLVYYVMPYIEGESLRARLTRESRLSIDEAVRLTREIASALAHAHQQDVVHRDIKPENVLLADGVALVADFGIARALSASDAGSETALATRAGAVLGTPQYMSPEQAGGGETDARSDIYALACVLYELLGGRPPFVGSTAADLLRQQLVTEPRPITEIRAVPGAVAAVLAKGLAKVPADRHASALQFAEALSIAASGVPPPAGQMPGAAGNLPRARTRFIGREHELREGDRLLAETRLLTLTGIGGSGKTRLALQLAERVLDRYPDGAWFIDLAPLSDASQVADTVAAQLGVRPAPDQAPADAVIAHVRAKRLLLILDTCEHVLAAAADLTDGLLSASAGLTVVATSREGFSIEGERQMTLRSLATPAPESDAAVEAVGASDAVALFVDRARAAAGEFQLTAATAPIVAEICRRLDGIPLAIELAAARVKMLSVTQIRAMLDDRFRLLVGGRKSVPRHQTLQATIQWSYDQLSAGEQRLFRSLSVLAGGWSLDTAAALRGGAAGMDLVDDLTHLIDKSLVIVDREGRDEPRYRFLETVRQYAQERLMDAGESADVHRRSVEVFLDLAERAYAERLERDEFWNDRLELEHDNLRSAMEIALSVDPERYLQLAGSLSWFFHARSYFSEGREHLLRAVSATPAEPARPARARALWGIGITFSRQGKGAEGRPWMQAALDLWRVLGDQREVVVALEGIGWAEFNTGEDEAACRAFEDSLDVARALRDPRQVNQAMSAVAQVYVALHRVDEARAMANEIIAFSSAHGDKRNEHFGWHYLADCALIEGRCQESLGLYRKSLELAWAIGDRLEISFEIQGVAMSWAGLEAPARALELAAATSAEWERLGVTSKIRFWDALLDRYLGRARAALGPAEAARVWEHGRRLPFETAVTESLVPVQ